MPLVTDPKILVVEDDPQMCESIRALLWSHGFDVRTSKNVLDALNALLAIEYDLILLDLKLEDRCGFAVMDHLVEKKLDTQVIVVTGQNSENYAITALKKGAIDYLKKPFEPDDLLESVKRVLGRQKNLRELYLFKKIVAASSAAIIVGDLHGRIVYNNTAYHRLAHLVDANRDGATSWQTCGKPLPQGKIHIDEQIQKALASGMSWEGPVDMVNAAGQRFVIWKRVDPLAEAVGGKIYGVALMQDMTTQLEKERMVASSRERYRSVIDSQKDYLCRLDTDFGVGFVNKAYADYWGKTPHAMIGQSFMTLIPDSIEPIVLTKLMALRSGSPPVEIEYPILDSADNTHWQRWLFYGIRGESGDISEIQCIGRDVTREKLIEREIEENKEKFRNLAEITSDWIWEVDKDGVYTYASPVVHELLGYRPDEMIGKRLFDFMPDQESRRLHMLFQQAVISEAPLRNIENVNWHKNGKLVTLETSGVPILNKAGAVTGYRGVARDISARKFAERRLKEESDKLKQALAKVKRLSGMLPICASCKKIRDDKGYWNQIELYIESNSEAEFSHGLCPQCARKLYPELYKDEIKDP